MALATLETSDVIAAIDEQLAGYQADRHAVSLTIAKAIWDGENDGHVQRSPDPDMRWWNNRLLTAWGETPPEPLPGDQETKTTAELIAEFMDVAMREIYREIYRPSPLMEAIRREGILRREGARRIATRPPARITDITTA